MDTGTKSFDPVRGVNWERGQPVPYASLTTLFEYCEAESGRLKNTAFVADFFRSVIALCPDNLLPTVYLVSNKIAPAYEGKEMGVGDGMILKAIASSTGGTVGKLRKKMAQLGDLGALAQECRSKQNVLFA